MNLRSGGEANPATLPLIPCASNAPDVELTQLLVLLLLRLPSAALGLGRVALARRALGPRESRHLRRRHYHDNDCVATMA